MPEQQNEYNSLWLSDAKRYKEFTWDLNKPVTSQWNLFPGSNLKRAASVGGRVGACHYVQTSLSLHIKTHCKKYNLWRMQSYPSPSKKLFFMTVIWVVTELWRYNECIQQLIKRSSQVLKQTLFKHLTWIFHGIHSVQWDALPLKKPVLAQHNMYNINMLYLLRHVSAFVCRNQVCTPSYLKPNGRDNLHFKNTIK